VGGVVVVVVGGICWVELRMVKPRQWVDVGVGYEGGKVRACSRRQWTERSVGCCCALAMSRLVDSWVGVEQANRRGRWL
jgi:hypothetical protein